MALLYIEGFEGGGTSNANMLAYVGRKYTVHDVDIFNDTGRFDNNCAKMWYDGSFGMNIANKVTLIVGFAFKASVWTDTDKILLRFMDGASDQLTLRIVTGGELRLYRGAVLLGTTSGLGCIAGNWYYIEFKATIDNATGSYELRVGGTNVLSASGVDTQNTANAQITEIRFMGDSTTCYFYFDDIYVLDTTGAENNDFLGNRKVVILSPDSAGDNTDFTPSAGNNYENVDDGRTVDDDTTHNETSTTTHKDLHNYSAGSDLANIAGISINTEARETDAVNYSIKSVVKSSGTESADAGQALSSGYTIKNRIVEQDPHTSAAWLLANINAAQFGYEAV